MDVGLMKIIRLHIILLLLFFPSFLKSQTIFYQEVFNGGVTGDGFTTTLSSGQGDFNLSINPNSTIKKAFLISGRHGLADPIEVLFENTVIEFNEDNIISEPFLSPFYAAGTNGLGYVHGTDVTNEISPLVNTYSITIPPQNSANERYTDFFLIVFYEYASLPETNGSILINNKDIMQNMFFQANDLNPINNMNDVGMSIHGGYMCDTINEPTLVFVEGQYLGKIGGNDYNSNTVCGGVVGSFYYEQNTLYGLGDDLPDIEVAASDGLSNIMTIPTMNSTDFNAQFQVQADPSHFSTNPVWSLFLTYTTPCSSFPTALTVSDTTICEGEPLQLGASGGINYDWLPQTGLSCYDCPNPAFTGNSSTVYTVRIWSTDSCSKVLPVHVKVNPKPKFESIQITPSGCGKSTGSIVAMMDTAQAPYQYTLDNQAPQPDSLFTGLASGNYALSVENVHGCTNDTLLTIQEELSVTASFTVNPVTGSAPLWVQTENTSTNATDYLWEWSGGTTTDEHPGFTLDTAGNYTLTLIAYDGAPHCSDTFSLQVLVYDSLQVSIPNVFTPNQDGRNDFFGITTNVSVSGRVALFNRWGNPLHELEFTTQPQVFEPLWDGTDTSEGVYFYQLELTTDTETYGYSGFVQLVR
ncbi:hypothetical protein GCM10009118_24420 [Wandonia haliotis]|uniref:Gliding motility-associated C-terminal domain-containing protein n=1 Tax=Wandonia haliotis TaxID=574963 RepID=A0ABP3Y8U1_9FLAO